jgi:hypothetical protein
MIIAEGGNIFSEALIQDCWNVAKFSRKSNFSDETWVIKNLKCSVENSVFEAEKIVTVKIKFFVPKNVHRWKDNS